MNTITETMFIGEATMVTSDCTAIAFNRPIGSNPVNINGFPLTAGQTLRISQNTGEVDRTQYQVFFSAGAGDNECYVFRTLNLDGYSDGNR